VCFPQPTRVGDSLRALTKVLNRKERGAGEPGIVHVQTLGVNQKDEICVRYERKILIPPRPPGIRPEVKNEVRAPQEKTPFAWPETPQITIPAGASHVIPGWTAGATFFDDFKENEVIVHANGRTITDEHVPWTYRLGNTHPLHYDSVYSHAQASPMGGNPVVYGGLVFSWIAGLASRDMTENMIWDLGYTEGYHTQPARTGDTLYAVSRVLSKAEGPAPGTGIITAQLIGLKNVRADEAIAKHSHALFIKENDKKKMGLEKIPEKIFEIERKILVRKRS
jgi:2-methylfumaryl-CoA hydratase